MALESLAPSEAQLDGDRVVASLHNLGVRYIVVEAGAEPYEDLPPAQLIAALVRSESPRVRLCVIPLLLRHPEFAAAVPELVTRLPQPQAELLRRNYTAAVYLQRMYRPALEIYLGQKPRLPDYFSAEKGLPSPDEYHGEIGLRELVARLPPPIDWWYTYLDPVQMFLSFLAMEETYGWTDD